MPTDSSLVIYTAAPTPYIPIATNQTLQTILQNIDTAINTHNTAPNYSGYNLGPYGGYSITQTDGVTHPTNTQNFAEGIAKIVCNFEAAYNTFNTVTYVSGISVLTTAVNALQTPGLTYSYTGGGGSIAITNGMTVNQVLTATYTGVGNILALLNAPGSTWATLSITTPTNINTAFNGLITWLSALNTTVSGKQAAIAVIDNSANVLTSSGGTSTDTVRTTATLITTYITTLPTLTLGGFTWGAVTTGTTLTNSLQNTVNTLSSIVTNAVVAAGTGLVLASVGSTYQGKKLTIDTTYTTLYKLMIDGNDTTADFLTNKISAGTGISLAITSPNGNEGISITNTSPATSKVKVNSSDTTENYLVNKIPSTVDPTWGLTLTASAIQNNSQLSLIPSIGNPTLHAQSLLAYIASVPALVTQFENLVLQAAANPGAPITNLVVALSGTSLVLTWTHQAGSSQNAKFRQYSTQTWFSNGFSVTQPMSGAAATNTLTAPVTNIVYDFQVDTVYATGTVGSNINQGVYYTAQTLTTSVVAGVINVTQSPVMLDTIQYRLRNSVPTIIQNVNTTGLNPTIAFTAVGSGTYSIQFRYGSVVNGSTLYSDDVTQNNAWYTVSNIVVP